MKNESSIKERILTLRSSGYTFNQIVEAVGCAKSTVSYHCNRNGMAGEYTKLGEELIEEMNEYYKTHTLQDTAFKFKVGSASVTKYCEKKRVLLTDEERRERRIKSVSDRRKKIKVMAIEYLGGKCERCGYNDCVAAFDFHHKDPSKKDFSISSGGRTRSWEKIKKELDKCELLCANCHREHHYNE